MNDPAQSIFAQKYRVVTVDTERLVLRGVNSGEILTITNPVAEIPICVQDYPPGKLISLTDPSCAPQN